MQPESMAASRILCCLSAGFLLAPVAAAQEFRDLSLEQLMEVDMAVASRRPTHYQEVPAAVHVITREEIRRSGLRTLPEILRLVPGVHVARLSASRWAISARGFTGEFANSLLVMIDGRSVYNHLFSGVLWDEIAVGVDEIERIEVIRGPGGARWGANAVNGVIHVITRSAADTQGTVAEMIVGSGLRSRVGLRHGFQLGEHTHGRVFAQRLDVAGQRDAADAATPDSLERGRVGMRLDGRRGDDRWSVRGEVGRGDATSLQFQPVLGPPYGELVERQTTFGDGFLYGEWRREHAGGSATEVHGGYDYTTRREWDWLAVRRHRVDLEVQHSLAPLGGHHVVGAVTGRLIVDDSDGSPELHFVDPDRRIGLFGASLQDDIDLLPERLRLGIGVKLEYHDQVGLEPQPDLRLTWTPGENVTWWGSVSRAVRVPSRIDEDLRYRLSAAPGPGGMAQVLQYRGRRDLAAEQLWAFESGVRWRPMDTLHLDLAAFYNDYDDRTAVRPGTPLVEPTPVPHVVVPLDVVNGRSAESYGGELSARWTPGTDWLLHGSLSFLRVVERVNAPDLIIVNDSEGSSPRHQAQLGITRQLGNGWEAGALAFYYDHLPAFGTPGFVRLDLRLGWRPDPSRELSLVGQNLLDDRHPEFGREVQTSPTEVERGVYLEFVQRW